MDGVIKLFFNKMFRRIGKTAVSMAKITPAIQNYKKITGDETPNWGVAVCDKFTFDKKGVDWEMQYTDTSYKLAYYKPFYYFKYEDGLHMISGRQVGVENRVVDLFDFMGKVHLMERCNGLFDPHNRLECYDFVKKMLAGIEKSYGVKVLIIVNYNQYPNTFGKEYDMVVNVDDDGIRYVVNNKFFGWKKVCNLLNNHKWHENIEDNVLRIVMYFLVLDRYNYRYGMVLYIAFLGFYGIICSL